jgi:hypothetical protein
MKWLSELKDKLIADLEKLEGHFKSRNMSEDEAKTHTAAVVQSHIDTLAPAPVPETTNGEQTNDGQNPAS